ncbi:YitT family protein [Mycoplasmatota bacterium]|nr:YitT family protein [Mycoplasmatota bacterium]
MSNFHLEARRLFIVGIATIVYVIGVGYFIVPAGLLTGGITGFSIIIKMLFSKIDINMNLGLLVFILDIPVLIIGLKGVSRKFFYYTMFSIILQSILLGVFTHSTSIFDGDVLADSIIGGMLVGVGSGIALRAGASLGGMDVISQFLSLKKKSSVGLINITANGILLLISIIYFEPQVALYTLLGYITASIIVDKIHTGYKRVKVEIITGEGLEVKDKLLASYEHGITMYDAVGAYTGNQKKILTMVTQSHEVYDVKKSVLSIDPDAFITITPVRHLNGKFNQIIIK